MSEMHSALVDPDSKYVLGSAAYDEASIRSVAVTIYHPSALAWALWRVKVATNARAAGTAKMTGDADDPMGVCDPQGRVRNVKRLRVADLSLCPEIPGGNTQLPAYMIGERVASFIIDDMKAE